MRSFLALSIALLCPCLLPGLPSSAAAASATAASASAASHSHEPTVFEGAVRFLEDAPSRARAAIHIFSDGFESGDLSAWNDLPGGGPYQTTGSGNWSDPAIWSGGQLPGAGADVVISAGARVVYDLNSPVPIRTIHVQNGTLEFSRTQSTRLDVGMIMVSASPMDPNQNCSAPFGPGDVEPRPALIMGTPENPMPAAVTARIRLIPFPDIDPNCGPGIIIDGGRWEVHGAPLAKTWVELAQTALAGGKTVRLLEPVAWRAGDEIVLTGTIEPGGSMTGLDELQEEGWCCDASHPSNTEVGVVESVLEGGTRLELAQPLRFGHQVIHQVGMVDYGTYRGEVGNLTRNVIIESGSPDGVRGHTLYHRNSRGSISYASFNSLGKGGVLARYPIHFHVARDTMRGSYVRGAVVRDSDNRAVTTHHTNFIVHEDNIALDSQGHAYFLEDGTEVYNLYRRNIAALVQTTEPIPGQAIPWDENHAAGYWFANGRNAFMDNVTAEADGYGYHYDTNPILLPVQQPDGTEQTTEVNALPFIRFEGNEVHGAQYYGFKLNKEGRGTAQSPFIIRDHQSWLSWYSIGPDAEYALIDGFRGYRTAYGFYIKSARYGEFRNVWQFRPSNETIDFKDESEGLFVMENFRTDCAGQEDALFQLEVTEERDMPLTMHYRNYAFEDCVTPFVSGEDHDVGDEPQIHAYLHDWYGPGQDADVIPAYQAGTTGLSYTARSPEFADTVKVANVAMAFPPSPLAPVDSLPPQSVILSPGNDTEVTRQDGGLRVTGRVVDQSTTGSLTVNGVAATFLDGDFIEWEVFLPDLPLGEVILESQATDGAGNQEVNTHRITVEVVG